MTKKLPLQNGLFAIVDAEDYDRCMEYTWTYRKKTETNLTITTNSSNSEIRLHRFLMGVNEKEVTVTRISGDQLDYRKSNFIVVSQYESRLNKKGNAGATSKYKGVSYMKSDKQWRAQMTYKGKSVLNQRFNSEDEAARAYNEKALEIWGDKCFINVLGENNNNITLDMTPMKMRRSESIENRV